MATYVVIILSFLLVLTLTTIQLYTSNVSAEDRVTYTGAVVEYKPYETWHSPEDGIVVLQENALRYIEFMVEAREKGAHIIVFPENALTGGQIPKNQEKLMSVVQVLPDPAQRIVPCSLPDHPRQEVVKKLSCAAKKMGMYLVLTMPELVQNDPKDYPIIYNTQVVFDRSGALITRYRKKNLFLEFLFTPGTEDDSTAIFTTDFGVTFTLQICFDIVFAHPGLHNVEKFGIRDVAMSTSWFDEMPFLIADTVQNGWSRGLGINLLVAGFHKPSKSKLGSGIFKYFDSLDAEYVYDPKSGNKLIVSEITTLPSGSLVGDPKFSLPLSQPVLPVQPPDLRQIDSKEFHLIYHEDMSTYNNTFLTRGQPGQWLTETRCHKDGLCCHLTYQHSGSDTYLFTAYSGVVLKGFGVYKVYAQICGVVYCHEERLQTCGKPGLIPSIPHEEFGPFSIQGTFSVKYVYPTVIHRDLSIPAGSKFAFDKKHDDGSWNVSISTHNAIPSFMTGGMYGRWYDRDPM
ncbi:pantetheine hydrolase VNN2-like [Oratosquilla oratoria]|uniref:pantetheine hydrolase VNN2-like n=1 Tax=Oratosquilla oratoria TaxID=337810 RepID=UPI003F765B0A